jgi:hypothetical protein
VGGICRYSLISICAIQLGKTILGVATGVVKNSKNSKKIAKIYLVYE